MIAHPARARSGITLTEILISILIMGVGLVSLATLFPIGLIRLRDAARQSRSALLAESVVGDMGSKNLLDKSTFLETHYGVDPFTIDAITPPPNLTGLFANQLSGGLPVCYDPLWRSVTGYLPAPVARNTNGPVVPGTPNPTSLPFRFGAGFNVRNDPDGNPASAYGLQRISNFVPFVAPSATSLNTSTWPLTYIYPVGAAPVPAQGLPTLQDFAEATFVSPDDLVMQNNEAGQQILLNSTNNPTGTASGVVPMFMPSNYATPTNPLVETRIDYKYSWLFTGRQIDITNGTIFSGDIVIMENRPFGVETLNGTTTQVPSGETVVEAEFGPGGVTGYAPNASRLVRLRWPATMPDPEVKAGSWFADVTYELNPATSLSRTTIYPAQRCHWYQVAKKNDPIADTLVPNYRQMTLYTTTPLRAQTLLNAGAPAHVNTALIMPSVVNVYSKTFYVR